MREEKTIVKIKKLLALSKSPNENEAKAAMLKARELLIKHGLTERDLERSRSGDRKWKSSGTEHSVATGGLDKWKQGLHAVIAWAYGCEPIYIIQERPAHPAEPVQPFTPKRVKEYAFRGPEEYSKLCSELFCYAAKTVERGIKEKRLSCPEKSMSERYRIGESYGMGFVQGLREAIGEQSREIGWGLVPRLSGPLEEREADTDAATYRNGVRDGRDCRFGQVLGGR